MPKKAWHRSFFRIFYCRRTSSGKAGWGVLFLKTSRKKWWSPLGVGNYPHSWKFMGSSWEELTKSIEEIFKWLKGPYFKVSSWFEFWRLSAYLYWLVWFELSWVKSSRVANSSCSNPRASQVWTINLHKNFTTFSLSSSFQIRTILTHV